MRKTFKLLSALGVAFVSFSALFGAKFFAKAVAAGTTVTFTPGVDTSGDGKLSKNGVSISLTTTDNASYYQVYKSSVGTFSCSVGKITNITITSTASGTAKYAVGCFALTSGGGSYTYSGKVGTWTGSSPSVSLTANTNQVRMESISVTYSSEGGSSSSTGASTSTSTSSSSSSTSKSSSTVVNAENMTLKSTLRLVKTEGYKLSPTFTPSTTSNKKVTYSSSDSSIVTVDSTGAVTGVNVGNATITCASEVGGFVRTCDVTVTECAPNPVLEGDILDRDFTTSTANKYETWSNKASDKNTYSGVSAGSNSSIQLRSSDNLSGVISTASGMYIKKVMVKLDSNTSGDRDLYVFGSNTAYSSTADLYDGAKKGTLLGTLSRTRTLTLNVNEDYQYVGVRSADGTIYALSLAFVWETAKERAIASIESTYSNSQLKFESSYNEETSSYTFTNIELRFGGKIPMSIWNVIKNDVVEYGCALSYEDLLDNGYSTLRSEIDDFIDDANSLDEIIDATSYGMMVSASGNEPFVKSENDTDYALFNGVLQLSSMSEIDDNLCAVAYVKLTTGYIFLNETKKNARMLANEYKSNAEMVAKYGAEALNAFANYVVA